MALVLAVAFVAASCSPSQPAPDPTEPAEPQAEAPAVPESDDPPAQEPSDEPAPDPDPEPEPPPVPPSRAALAAHLEPLVAAAADRAGDDGLGVVVVDEYGREVVAHGPDAPLLPASTMKSVTAAALLTTLGPEARLTTLVEATAPVQGDGTLDGDLAILGSGDPALATEEYARWVYPARPRTRLEDLADQLVDLGLTHVTGDVVGVPGEVAGEGRAEGWLDRYFSDFDARLVAGLTVDAGLVTLLRYPDLEDALEELRDEEEGEADPDEDSAGPRRVRGVGALDVGRLDLDGVTVEALARAGLDRLREDPDADVDGMDEAEHLATVLVEVGDADPTDVEALDPAELDADTLAALLGLEGPGPVEARVDHAADPAAHAAGELVRLLEDREVTVDGQARSGDAPEGIVGRLAFVDSPPLEELLSFAMKRSDNHMTDQLFHVLAWRRTGEGSWLRGDRALRQVLDHLGIDHDGARFVDGSGLSRDDRLTARLLVDLDRVMTDSRHGSVWASLMAVMGEDGTLRQRLRDTPAQGRFVGKTGTLRDVTALHGTVQGDDGRRYHLAVLVNDAGEGRWAGRQLMDELVLALVADLDGCEIEEGPGDDTLLGRPPSVVTC